MKYEDKVRKICGDNWHEEPSEKIGGIGVACLMAYMRGVKPTLIDLAKHLEISPDDISVAFSRLVKNGAFDKWNVKNDPELLGNSGNDDAYRAWAFVAAVSSGFLGVPNV